MKKYLVLIVLISSFLWASAQNDDFKTIFGNKELRISGFGGPIMSFTSLDGKFAHMMGGGGGIMIGDFFIGGYGMGKTNKTKSSKLSSLGNVDIDFGHGGLWLGYTFISKKAIHPVVHSMIGWGQISHSPDMGQYAGMIDPVNVFVFIPTVEMEMNFTKFFKIGIGGNIRLAAFNNSDESNFDAVDLISPGAFMSFKFGWF